MTRDTATHDSRSKLRRTLSKWANSDEVHARELEREVRKAGCVPVAECSDRDVVELHGTIRTVTLRPRGGAPALEAELYDGTASLTLVFLGRRRIGGIEPGRPLSVVGRLGRDPHHGRVMFNPRYTLTET